MKFYPNGTVPKQANMYFIYGDGGTGKTSLAKQFEGNKMLFSFDLSTNVLIGEKDISVVQLESGDAPNIQSLIDKWVLGALSKPEYEVIILDNMTALQNLVLENIDGASRDGRQNYQKLQLWFRQLGTKLRESNKTIYATAHQVDNGASGLDGKGRFSPDMNEKTFNAFTSMFDLVGRIYIDDDKRLIDLNPENGNHAKNRIDDRKLIEAKELINNHQEEGI
ncbi:AAA family ATPase [Enterococcus faecium]|uniref:AAA family ATPase n=1 Tax=Companilactobacillus farciminis TaxID=1612 RepID=A0A921HPS7_9LACO|nr:MULTISPECIES: AAA family ATPase [Bacillota]HJF86059.1 AAA family ATPase [Companilactobacillus farciminis]EGP5087757.1 nucleotide-binding protein [Enterococcus faecium]KNB95796.1 phage nucleotide-binding protein [Enterococcus faecium]NJE65029.1 nucleotide-binding protein [Enterococcus durans]QKX67181.1 AAA family ATPase [Enterococcus hirae]